MGNLTPTVKINIQKITIENDNNTTYLHPSMSRPRFPASFIDMAFGTDALACALGIDLSI
jgi:hypothetical protein